jgi:hypothetical protein
MQDKGNNFETNEIGVEQISEKEQLTFLIKNAKYLIPRTDPFSFL